MVYGVQPSQEMASDLNDKPLPLAARTENAPTIPFNLLPDDVVGDIFIEYLRERSVTPLSGAPTNLAVTVHGSGSTNTPILLTFPGHGGKEVSPSFDEAFHLLTAQSHRWKEFSMFDREDDNRPPRNHVWKEIRASNLENLIIFFGKRWSSDSAFQLMKTFSSSEKLKSVILGCHDDLALPQLAFPWKNIQFFDVNCGQTPCQEILYLLSKCTRVTEFNVDVPACCHTNPHPSTPSIVVPALKTMHFVYLRRFPRFLDSLTFPSLEDLDMMKIIAGAISPTAYADLWRTLAELGERSEWRLRRLRFPAIRKLDVDVPHGVEILATSHSFVHLTSLTLACPLVDDALELLTFREGYEPLPRVATMLLLDCRSTDGVLSAMIKSRTAIRSTGLTPALQDINAYSPFSAMQKDFTKSLEV
ncbi:hypothetical protein CC1G_04904 [Coprinopsis cinerea okayama7|uniref:F-box domain-containing protein n=1 Tax=Coprinopsis cinerea (strain Okayama-7 / 130 / ATCC MYA-4618 / FGSC 9003) TaxID=240176 RepID=A8PFG8_COPC7|nr:hypothetical protein CC1G_04904 [Coprinopsis cinerea okayama7\|eukprot:XP_001841060.2 hypothetical protein CC1G_04904 [Coprinopsis cinerea okayama7\